MKNVRKKILQVVVHVKEIMEAEPSHKKRKELKDEVIFLVRMSQKYR